MIRVGVIGTGKFASHHAKVWQGISEVVLIGACGGDPERTRAFAEAHGCKAFAHVEDLIDACDVIDIVSANDTHGEHALKAAAAGRHFIVEKPLDIDLEKAREVCAAAESAGVMATVVSNYRYNRAFRAMKVAIEGGDLGQIVGGQVSVLWPRSVEYYAAHGGWRGDPSRAGGGVLIHQCIHHIDLLHWWFGAAEAVHGRARDWTTDGADGVERTFLGHLEFAGGFPVQLFCTTRGGDPSLNRVSVYGTAAFAHADEQSFVTSGQSRLRRLAARAADYLIPRRQAENSSTLLRRQFIDFTQAVSGDAAMGVTLTDGLRALETVRRLYADAAVPPNRAGEKT